MQGCYVRISAMKQMSHDLGKMRNSVKSQGTKQACVVNGIFMIFCRRTLIIIASASLLLLIVIGCIISYVSIRSKLTDSFAEKRYLYLDTNSLFAGSIKFT